MKKRQNSFQIKFRTIIDNDGKLFGRYDIFLPLFIIIALTLAFFIGRVLLQKDTYITAELYASGGEWWWNNPVPPYWLTNPVEKGDVELDPQGNVLVEVLDTRKFEVGERKMLWMKVRLKVTPQNKADQFRFRREPIQVGSLIHVAPNNIKIFSSVMWIEGVREDRAEVEKVITLREYGVFPWHADAFTVGDTMKADDSKVLAEILEKDVIEAEMVTTDDAGNVLVKTNPTRRDITLKLRVLTTESAGINYFSYFQPVKVGFYMFLPFEKANFSGNVIAVE
ncbi:MAG: DUF4330 domain-containing protein [bacterium]|nr:DUF4330 domain-containing protein [bacterium]